MKFFSGILLAGLLLTASCGDNRQTNIEPEYRSIYKAALVYADHNDYDKAIEGLEQVITLKPDFDSAYVEMAYNYLLINNLEKAKGYVEEAVKINPKNNGAQYCRAMVYESLGQKGEALKAYGQLISQKDTLYYLEALISRGLLYFYNREYESAIYDFSSILAVDSLDIEALRLRGVAKSQLDVYPIYQAEVEAWLADTVLKPNPFKDYAMGTLGGGSPIMWDTKGALEDFNSAIRIDPEFAIAYYERSKVFSMLNKDKQAIEDINKALEIKERAEFFLLKADILSNMHEYEEALMVYDDAIALDSENGMAYANRADLKRRMEDREGYKADLEKARSLGIDIEIEE